MSFNLSGLFRQWNTQAPVNQPSAGSNTVSAQNGTGEGSAGCGLQQLQNMLAGETFSGQIVGTGENTVLMQLADGSTFSARLADGSAVSLGQNLTFLVQENIENMITLKPLMTSEQQAFLIEKALDAASFPATDTNINIVKELLNLNMPVNAEAISNMVKNSMKFPEASLNTIANLVKLNMPVTAENVMQFEAYQNYEHSILKELGNIQQDLSSFLSGLGKEQAGGGLSSSSGGLVFFGELLQALYHTPAEEIQLMPDSALLNTFMNEASMSGLSEKIADVFSGSAGADGANAQPAGLTEEVLKLVRDTKEGQLSVEQFLSRLTEQLQAHPEIHKQMGKLFQSGEMDGLLQQMINETLKLTPADVAHPEGIKNYYKRVRGALEKAQEAAGKEEAAVSLGKDMASVKSNIDFMNDLNKNMSFFQIPVHFSERDANGELYVFTNKKALQNNPDQVSALLHLELDHLGPMDIYVKLSGKNVSTNFCLESGEMLDFVYANIDRLNRRLEALGYTTKFEMKVTEPAQQFDLMEDFVQKDQTGIATSQYIFDMKA